MDAIAARRKDPKAGLKSAETGGDAVVEQPAKTGDPMMDALAARLKGRRDGIAGDDVVSTPAAKTASAKDQISSLRDILENDDFVEWGEQEDVNKAQADLDAIKQLSDLAPPDNFSISGLQKKINAKKDALADDATTDEINEAPTQSNPVLDSASKPAVAKKPAPPVAKKPNPSVKATKAVTDALADLKSMTPKEKVELLDRLSGTTNKADLALLKTAVGNIEPSGVPISGRGKLTTLKGKLGIK